MHCSSLGLKFGSISIGKNPWAFPEAGIGGEDPAPGFILVISMPAPIYRPWMGGSHYSATGMEALFPWPTEMRLEANKG
jgi:hypothetical protein